ncbi:hypothetical protein G9A89_000552, partial [Geosiphon pyriformis]
MSTSLPNPEDQTGVSESERNLINLNEFPWRTEAKSAIKPKAKDLKDEEIRRACKDIQPVPRPNDWSVAELMEWLANNPVQSPADELHLETRLAKLRDDKRRVRQQLNEYKLGVVNTDQPNDCIKFYQEELDDLDSEILDINKRLQSLPERNICLHGVTTGRVRPADSISASRRARGGLPPHALWSISDISYCVYNPAVRYTLPQCFFDQQVLNQAQALSLQRIIAKSGYNQRTARALMFGPSSYAGGGFLPWYLLQGEG